jgi:hypothetical protein
MTTRFKSKDTSELDLVAIAAYMQRGGQILNCNTSHAKNSNQLGRSKVLYKSNSLKVRMRGRIG